MPSNSVHITTALHHPLGSYMGVSLRNLRCLIGEDEASVIRYTSADVYAHQNPHLQFFRCKDVVGIGEKDSKIHDGVYRVCVGGQSFVYKEPTGPDDIKSQVNEIESLTLLSESPPIIKLHGLVISQNPYLTRRGQAQPPIVKGLLLQYASQGNLGSYLMSNAKINWTQLPLGNRNHVWAA